MAFNPAQAEMQNMLALQSLQDAAAGAGGGSTMPMVDEHGNPIINCYLTNGYSGQNDLIGSAHVFGEGLKVVSFNIDEILAACKMDPIFNQNPFMKFFDGNITPGKINAFQQMKMLSGLGDVSLAHTTVGEKMAAMSATHNPQAMPSQGMGGHG